VGQHVGVDLQRLRHEAFAFTGEFDRLLALPHQLSVFAMLSSICTPRSPARWS